MWDRLYRRVLRRLMAVLSRSRAYSLRVTFADGSVLCNHEAASNPDIDIRFLTPRAERRTLIHFYHGLFEAYFDQEVDIDGDCAIARLAQMGHDALSVSRRTGIPTNPVIWVRQLVQELCHDNLRLRIAKENADCHYALDPRFFEYQLGTTVGYSEGYWAPGTRTLDQAKYNNYEYICRKLRLKPGERVLEVGSGWGYMPILMAKKYGAYVTVYNPVHRQNDYMRKRFEQHGVADRIRLVEKDHREIVEETAAFDKFVSIGVQEHAGRHCYRSWMGSIAAVLKPGGIGCISTTTMMLKMKSNFLITRYIFPGGHIPSLPFLLRRMDDCGLVLVDIEFLWPHYKRTVSEWADNVERRWPKIHALDPDTFDESFRRRWRFYLEGTIENFDYALDLSHIVFTNGRAEDVLEAPRDVHRQEAEFATDDMPVNAYPLRHE